MNWADPFLRAQAALKLAERELELGHWEAAGMALEAVMDAAMVIHTAIGERVRAE